MPVEPPKPKCKVCHQIKQEANRWFRVERIKAEGRVVGMQWRGLVETDVLDHDADFVCGPGCLEKETSEAAQEVIEGRAPQETAAR